MKNCKKLFFLVSLLFLIFPFNVNAEEVDSGFTANELIKNSSKVEISVLNEDDDSLISDIEFEIQDEAGNVLFTVTSKDEVYIIEELEEGIYYYVEKTVPEEYELKTDKVEFTVGHEDDLVNVRVTHTIKKNSLEIINKETTILIGVAMFDIALGIGIIVYVKKNQDKK